MFESPGAVFDEGRGLASWLLRAALARFMLAKFLQERSTSDDFASFLLTVELPSQVGGLTWLCRFRTCLSELRRGQPASPIVPFAACRQLYRSFTGVGSVAMRPSNLAGVLVHDPVSWLVGYTLNGASSPEILFLRKAFSYLDNAPDDTEFAARSGKSSASAVSSIAMSCSAQ